jgi:hypothetical protein
MHGLQEFGLLRPLLDELLVLLPLHGHDPPCSPLLGRWGDGDRYDDEGLDQLLGGFQAC